MAVRAFPVSTKSGISAAALVVTLILGALCAVISRAEAGTGFIGADRSALHARATTPAVTVCTPKILNSMARK